MKNKMKVCEKCFKPKTETNICNYCGSDNDAYSPQNYTEKQWEYFIDSLKGGCWHDFNPWEFSEEDGHITRHDRPMVMTGPTPIKKKRKNNNRKITKGRRAYREGVFCW